MTHHHPYILAILLLTSCLRPSAGSDSEATADTLLAPLPSSQAELYDQGRTEACWLYAFCACIEHEAARRGDDVLLSRQWLLTHLMMEQTLERYEIANDGGHPSADAGRGAINMRGVGADAVRLIDTYGLVPYQHERSRIRNSRVLQRRLIRLVDRTVQQRRDRRYLYRSMEPLMPRFTVAREEDVTHDESLSAGESFFYLSMRYTPQQFAESVMYFQQWQWYASTTSHPEGAVFPLEVADNRRYCLYRNKSMKELHRMVVASLAEGHAVYWEYGFEPSRNPRGGDAASDHAMAIVGRRPGGFLCLNSYGSAWGSNGYCTVSDKYFMRHTCNVGIVGP